MFLNMSAVIVEIGLLPKLIINLNCRATEERRKLRAMKERDNGKSNNNSDNDNNKAGKAA